MAGSIGVSFLIGATRGSSVASTSLETVMNISSTDAALSLKAALEIGKDIGLRSDF